MQLARVVARAAARRARRAGVAHCDAARHEQLALVLQPNECARSAERSAHKEQLPDLQREQHRVVEHELHEPLGERIASEYQRVLQLLQHTRHQLFAVEVVHFDAQWAQPSGVVPLRQIGPLDLALIASQSLVDLRSDLCRLPVARAAIAQAVEHSKQLEHIAKGHRAARRKRTPRAPTALRCRTVSTGTRGLSDGCFTTGLLSCAAPELDAAETSTEVSRERRTGTEETRV